MKTIALIPIFIVLSLLGSRASAAQATGAGIVIDLEAKITQQIKAQIHSVDPDAVVSTVVEIKRVNANLLGTQLQAVGIFATGENQMIEDEDIQSVTVTVMSSLPNFPPALTKILESTIKGITKQSRLQVVKMDPAIQQAIQKQKEHQKSGQEIQKANSEQLSKLHDIIAGAVREVPMGILQLLGLIAIMQLLFLGIRGYFQTRSFNKLSSRIAEIKIDGGAGGGSSQAAAPVASAITPEQAPRGGGGGGGGGGTGTTINQENPFKNLPVESLRALFSDAYWCEQDGFASWVWRQLSATDKIQLAEAWPQLSAYAQFLNRVEPAEGTFHLDIAYLKPQPCHHLSNDDLLKSVRDKKHLWHHLSSMRRQSFKMDLQDRLKFMSAPQKDETAAWPPKASAPRSLPMAIEISGLSTADEEFLFKTPNILSREQRKQFPSLIWLAMLEAPLRTKVLEELPAQALAEIWRGPEPVLEKIKEVLPAKKRELLEDYSKRIRPKSDSPWLAAVTKLALEKLDEQEAKTSVPPLAKAS